MPFVSTLESLTAGPLAWVDTALLPTGVTALLDKPSLSEDLTTADSTIVPATALPAIAKTITFTAPVACTIRNMVFLPCHRLAMAGTISEHAWLESAYALTIGKVTVTGTGPDVGVHVDGYGIPCGLFSLANLLIAPRLNLRLDAGDVVAFTIYNAGAIPLAYHATLTYDEGQDTTVAPTRFIGATAPPGVLIPGTTGLTAASGIITVIGATSPGDQIEIWGRYSDASGPNAGGPYGAGGVGGALTGAAGGGTSGTNTWDTNTVGITPIRDAILAALTDGGNLFASGYTAVSSGLDSVIVTRILTGPHGNTDTFTVTPTSLSALPSSGNLGGGVAGTGNLVLQSPSVDTIVDRVYAGGIDGGRFPETRRVQPPIFKAVNVGGMPEPSFATTLHDPDPNVFKAIQGSVTISALDTIDIDMQGQMGTSYGAYVLTGIAA